MGKPVAGEVVVLPFPQSVVLYSVGKINAAKLQAVRAKIRGLFA
jgi:hypothetical protein